MKRVRITLLMAAAVALTSCAHLERVTTLDPFHRCPLRDIAAAYEANGGRFPITITLYHATF